jgi:hypothetical protein
MIKDGKQLRQVATGTAPWPFGQRGNCSISVSLDLVVNGRTDVANLPPPTTFPNFWANLTLNIFQNIFGQKNGDVTYLNGYYSVFADIIEPAQPTCFSFRRLWDLPSFLFSLNPSQNFFLNFFVLRK